MADYAHEQTDKIIEKMEKQVAKEYKQAEKELTKKIKDYLKKFEEKDKAKQKQLADGQITQEEYNNWKIGQIATGDRWKAMRDTLAEEITKANDIAKSTINGHMEDVYSLNHNYATYQAEKDAMIDTSYTLYNRRSTEELFKNKKSLLPAPKEGTQAWYAAHNKDLRWNQQKINSSLIQGILQGDSIPQIAKRLREVVGMNSRSAMRNARTMTTSIENKGRDDAYSDLREKGIELETVWVATLDDRTRHSHRLLHGEIRNEETGVYSNGLRYPADPMGEPEEVYNCRCSETSYVKGFPVDIPRWSPKMGDMTYEEWLGEHEEQEPVSVKDSYVKDPMLNEIEEKLSAWGIDKLETHEYEEIPPQEEIINKIGGGDLTKGSCMSLAWTYAGNKGGIDVTDFRGGKCCTFFSQNINIDKILRIADIKSTKITGGNDIKCATELLKSIAKDDKKEYILITGKHASVVRRNEGVLQYLELQSATNNGFRDFTENTLRNRFGCQRSHSIYGSKVEMPNWLVDLESLTQSEDFKNILPYLNTNEGEQRKGSAGYAK